METYNDYENMIYGYLKNYMQFKAKSKDFAIQINTITEQINSVADIRAAQSDSVYSSNHDNKSSVEKAYERKQKYLEKLRILKLDKAEIDGLLERLDNVLEMLDPIERTIIQIRYIQGCRWTNVSLKVKYSERNCQRIAVKAISKLTRIIFGKFNYEQKRLFVFANNQYTIN